MKHIVGVMIEIAVSMMGYVDANLASLLKFPRSIPLPRNRTCVIRQSRFRPAANSGSSSWTKGREYDDRENCDLECLVGG